MVIRIARPTTDPAAMARLYAQALGWQVLGGFEDHQGFDGAMVGQPGVPVHLEFTRQRGHPLRGQPTAEDLLVVYVGDAFDEAVARIEATTFQRVASHNPYWDRRGRTYVDPDGYRIVLHPGTWPA